MSDLMCERLRATNLSTTNEAADLIEQLQQRNVELAATVEQFVELRDHLPNVRQWVIEFEKLVHKTPRQNLNAVKREHFAHGVEYVLEELTAPIPFNIDRVLNQQYPSTKE